MLKVIPISDKYTIILDLEEGTFSCERYGKPWRDLIGDNLMLTLLQKYLEGKEAVIECPDCGYKLSYGEFIYLNETQREDD